MARRLRLGELHLRSLGLAGYVHFRSDFKEVLLNSVHLLVASEQEVGNLDVLFQLELQILAEIVHVDFKVVDEKSGGANVCH